MSSSRSSNTKGAMDVQARFESMRGVSKNVQILRRHHDLGREGEKEILALEKETRIKALKILRLQSEYTKRLKEFESLEDTSRTAKKRSQNKHQVELPRPKLQKEKKEVLLFRIEKRDDRYNYIREETKKPDIPDIFIL